MNSMPNGYTIIEAMIFLIISSALLGSVMLLVNGKQERTRFTQGINSFDRNLGDVLNDVSTGYYPTDESFKCSYNSGSGTLSFPTGSASQGTNTGCVFLGRVIELERNTHYNLFTLAGAQSSTSLSESNVLLGTGGRPGVEDRRTLPNDIEIKDVKDLADPLRNIKGLAIISEFSETSVQTGKVSGNASRVTVYEVLNNINNAGKPGAARMQPISSEGLVICLQQGGINGKKAAIQLGKNSQQSRTEVKFDGIPGVCPS